MKLGLHQIIGLECNVCRQGMDSQLSKDTQIAARLFGSVAYAICPSCGQEPPDFKDRNYRARAKRYRERSEKLAKQRGE